MKKLIIIGAGAAGLLAAGTVKNAIVTVLDSNEKIGKKLYITGKGRCNFTNACEPREFLSSVVNGGKFLQSAIYGFTPDDAITLMNENGCKTKIERGRRAFPLSDKASDIIKALERYASKNGANIVLNAKVSDIVRKGSGFCVTASGKTYDCDAVLIATGGKSYSSTGSDGSGYALAQALGHSIVKCVPSLVSMKVRENVACMQGLSLKNVTASIEDENGVIKSGGVALKEFGEMLFTGNGVSGPIILSLSARANRLRLPFSLYVDLKPSLDFDTLDKRVIREFDSKINKQFKNCLDDLLPKSAISYIIKECGISETKHVNEISRAERGNLVSAMKRLKFTVKSLGGYEEAVVTSGGVDTREINPKTMESKVVPNLYFCGEVLDVDALTGGYNIQIAFSTAYAAAKAIGEV